MIGLVIAGLTILIVPELRWRGIVVARKLTGLLTDVSWADLGDIAGPRSGFELKHLARWGNPYSTIEDPYQSSRDRARGRELFGLNCAKCHGTDARGGLGPALVGRSLSHGDSDWAVYRTITSGVPGTAMVGGLIERRDVWRVISYLRDAAKSGETRTGAAGVDAERLGPAEEVTPAHLLASSTATGEWLLPGGSYDGRRFSRDSDINAGNVAQLSVRWVYQLPHSDAPNESGPIVSGHYLYVTVPPGTVIALDAESGAKVWQFTRAVPPDIHVCCLATNRGVAVVGRFVYFGTLDSHLIALDATTGQPAWDRTVADYKTGYSITSAPLPVGDLIITGVAGSEFPIRGFINAYEAATGNLRWRFDTVPAGPDEPTSKTWGGDSWKTGGGATWGIGAYDPELDLLYWGVATAAPDFNAALHPGDNLYANCLLALKPSTGKLAWYFQFLPGDDHDWDSTQTPSLIDLEQDGQTERLLAVANRGGFFYVLDRKTGRFIRGAPFAKQTWATGLSSSGRPIRAPDSTPSAQGTYIFPSANGATNWWPSAYSPTTRLYYVNVEETGALFFAKPESGAKPGRLFIGGSASFSDPASDFVRAIDPISGTVRWERKNSTVTSAPRGGLLATQGGLLFGSDGARLYALDASSGRELWSFNTGGHISAPPMTYRIGGKQVLAVVAGQDLVTFALQPPR